MAAAAHGSAHQHGVGGWLRRRGPRHRPDGPGHAPHGVAAASAFTLAPLVVATAPQLPRRARAGFVVLVVLSFATWAAGPGLGERITAYLEIAGLVWLAAAGPARP
ncbi:MAG: hypothetical protein ACTHNT_07295 [Actinomycetales bacterium]